VTNTLCIQETVQSNVRCKSVSRCARNCAALLLTDSKICFEHVHCSMSCAVAHSNKEAAAITKATTAKARLLAAKCYVHAVDELGSVTSTFATHFNDICIKCSSHFCQRCSTCATICNQLTVRMRIQTQSSQQSGNKDAHAILSVRVKLYN
jgi:hypothetical protein